jgi:hypothetical protein
MKENNREITPGWVAFLGSGETAAAGGQWFDQIAAALPAPLDIAILETPAGFELNSQRVAQRVADYLAVRLQNYRPRIQTLPLRKRDTGFSPDNGNLCAPLLASNLIYLGAGSPTYTARQLNHSYAWDLLQARQRLGAAVGLASASAIAAGTHVLPVYEIFKAGLDPHWQPGLDLLGPYGLHLVIISHWNNNEGGAELDTSRCFIGQERFTQLMELLPTDAVVLGLDEHTGLILDLANSEAFVVGRDSIHILKDGKEITFQNGARFPLQLLGDYHPLAEPALGLPVEIWDSAAQHAASQSVAQLPPPEVQELASQRQAARLARDWQTADRLRADIAALGWIIKDGPAGPQLEAVDY